ncbi:MAG TPA: DUF433 domain-containing protein [Longimicrobium sp.]|jgi:uncharacterized protein (DUF433 family)
MPATKPSSHPRIERRPGVWGGKAVVAGTRIPVFMLLSQMRSGWSDERVMQEYPSLDAQDVRAVAHYGEAFPAEVAADDAAYDRIVSI